jgi:undecaprenyl-diphosphatase
MRTPRGLLAPALAVAGVAVFLLLAVLVAAGLSDAIDVPIIRAVRAPELHGVLQPLRYVTELGSTIAAVGVTSVVALLVAYGIGPWRHGIAAAAAIIVAALGNSLIKLAVARTRPELIEPIIREAGFSFPSGHASHSAVGYGILAVLVSRTRLPRAVRVGIVTGLVVLVFLIGLSRVWLGVHYPTDVLAGWVAGGVVAVLFASFTRDVSREAAPVAVDAPADAERVDDRGPSDPSYDRDDE